MENIRPFRILFIDPNRIKPTPPPISFDYLVSHLDGCGIITRCLDFCLSTDPIRDVFSFVPEFRPHLIAISLRNLDDSIFASDAFYLDDVKTLIKRLRTILNATMVLGGSGFSISPVACLKYAGADLGILGEGEYAFSNLVMCLKDRKNIDAIPGLVFQSADGVVSNPPWFMKLEKLKVRRNFVNNVAYYQKGSLGNIQTKRGCPQNCIYCVVPQIEGQNYRFRALKSVSSELNQLIQNGIRKVFICDSEFNMPRQSAERVCSAWIQEGISDRFQWCAYVNPTPFDLELARLMKRASCAGLTFTADSGSDSILKAYGKNYRARDLEKVAEICNHLKITFGFTLLLGGPGETIQTMEQSTKLMKDLNPDLVQVITGVRVYPNTPLAGRVLEDGISSNPNLHGHIDGNRQFLHPIYYISEAVGPEIQTIVKDIIGEDPRFTLAESSVVL